MGLKKNTLSRRSTVGFLASRKLVSTTIRTREGAALGYPVAKISLEQDDMLTLFLVVEAMLMPPIHRTQAATQASTTTVHLGSKRAVKVDTGDVGLVNLDSILWRVWPATLVTLASEHNGHNDFGPNDCLASTMKFNVSFCE